MATDLQKVMPRPETIHVTGKGLDEDVVVNQLYVGQLPEVLARAQILVELFNAKIDPRELFFSHTGDVLNLLPVLLDKPRDWVDRLDIDSALELFLVAVEVNLDFFVQRVMPMALLAFGKLKASYLVVNEKTQTTGETPSSPSSPVDTPTKPS